MWARAGGRNKLMEIKDYPAESPKGIFHFPQGVFCLSKQKDTGKESVKIIRISGDEFELKIIPKDLTESEKKAFPIRVCEYEKLEEKDIEKEPKEIVKKEERIDLTVKDTCIIKVQDGEILKIGNTIVYTAGTNIIALSPSVGAGDSWGTAYTMANVLAACGAVVTQQGANAYDVSARMHFLSGVYFISEKEFVELKPNPINPSYAIDADAGSHIRIGNYNSGSDYSYDGARWDIYMNACTGNRLDRFDGELLVYGSNIWSDSLKFVDSFNFWGTTRIYDTQMEGNAYISGADIEFKRVTWAGKGAPTDGYDMLYASGYDFAWAGIKVFNSEKGIFQSSTCTSDVDLYDVTVIDSIAYDYYQSGTWLFRLINSVFDRNKTYVPANRIGCQECYTFNLLVTDNNNVPLSGALVVLKDKNGLQVFSLNTGADGKLPTQQIVKAWEHRYNVKTDFNDHVLKITLNGYADYETDITIDHKIEDDQVCLDGLNYTYDNIMAGLDDIKGTGFVKDTDSLVDIRPETDKIQTGIIDVPEKYKAEGLELPPVYDKANKIDDRSGRIYR